MACGLQFENAHQRNADGENREGASNAASRGFVPVSTWRTMFSSMTMAAPHDRHHS
jgi:hypothetical protein